MFAPLSPLQQVSAGYDRAAEVDLGTLTASELEAEVRTTALVEAQAYAHAAKVRDEFRRRGTWAESGALSAAAFVSASLRAPTARVKRQFFDAERLAALPAVLVALEAGAITPWHAELLLKVDNVRTHEALVANQVELVRWAMAERWRDFCRKVFAWLDEVDPDGPEPSVEKRDATVSRGLDGTAAVKALLTRVGAEIWIKEFRRLEREEFLADAAAARKERGRDPNHDELPRTAAQRRHDAFVRMAERSAMLPEDGRRGQPLFLVLVGEASFARVCELASGTPLRTGELAPHLDEATIQSIMLAGPFTAIAASQQRTFRGALRRAGQVIRRTCAHPYCDKPIDECQLDHYLAHSKGGETTLENEQLYCGPHNRMKADLSPEEWEEQLRPPEMWRPGYLDDP
jgi:Domain of unknown function (DUF222)